MNFNCTSAAEKIPRTLFIEASAGTGKTYVIEHYVVRAILEASLRKEEIDPRKCALITFTKAVARELRLRVKKALLFARSYFAGKEASEGIPEYFSLYEDKKQAARALSFFIDHFHKATITTIHGFCEKLLSIWEEESGEAQGAWEQNPKKWLEEFLQEESSITVDEWNILGRCDRYDHDHFRARVLEIMEDPSIFKTSSKATCIENLKTSLFDLKRSFPLPISQTAEILSSYARRFRGNSTREGFLHGEKKVFFEIFQNLLEGFSESVLQELISKGINLLHLFETPLRGFSPLDEESSAYFHVLIEKVWPHIETLMNPEDIRRRIALHAAHSFFAYTAATKKKTFDTLLRRTKDLCGTQEFCQKIAATFSCVIVDEFQDTDTTQLEIFERLFLQSGWKGNILFVGDPKQAIYAFRKADVYSYMRARDLLADHVRTLLVNYRASVPMVEALNRFFAGPEHPFIFYLPKINRHLHIVLNQSAAKTVPLHSSLRGALHIPVIQGNLGRKRNWPHEESETKFLCWMHDEIVSLEQEGVPFNKQAILVKDRYQARRVEDFLLLKNIPTCSWRLDLVTESLMYAWLTKAFLVLLDHHNKKYLLSLLFSMEGEESTCRAMACENDLTAQALATKEWMRVRAAFLSGGIGALSRELFACCFNGKEPLYDYLTRQEKGKDLILDLEQLFEALSLLDEKIPQDLAAYKEALEQIEEHFAEDRDFLLRRVDPDDKGVPILTMHRSKGLEFDVVYALGPTLRTPQSGGDLEEIDAEKLRLMYVALTRAKRRLYLPLFIEGDEKNIPRGQASPVELLLSCLHIGQTDAMESWADALYQGITSQAQLEVVSHLTKTCQSITTSQITQETTLLTCEKETKEEAHKNFQELKGRWCKTSSFSQEKRFLGESFHLSRGKAFIGNRFHENIASLLFEEEAVRSSREALFARCQDEELASLLFAALHVELFGRTTLDKIPREAMRCEVPFLFQDKDVCMTGSLDLLFQYEDKLYVIDWKTQEVVKPLREYIFEERYDLQAVIYKKAVLDAFPSIPWGGFFFVFPRNLVSGLEAIFTAPFKTG